jgi:uncharacterized protein (DUF2236 family)
MRCLVPVLVLILLSACDRETHVRKKVHSILPQIELEMGESGNEHAFDPEILNPWVEALGASKVVRCAEIAVEEMPQYRRAALWLLKAYAPEKVWRKTAASHPTIAQALPDVMGYGQHPRIPPPRRPNK